MVYIRVGIAEPFVVVCDGGYQAQIAYQRLDRQPFSLTAIDRVDRDHGLPEITLFEFTRLHDMAPE